MLKKVVLILAIITFVLAFVIARFWPSQSTGQDYKNGIYIIKGKPVTLINGYSEETIINSSAKTITRYFGNEVKADFNNDGEDDIAFLLTQSTGGTGLFYYLAVAMGNGHGYVPVGTDLIGDRIAPQTTEYKDGMITVNYADRASNEPFTMAPSIGLSKYYKIIDGDLRPVVPDTEGLLLANWGIVKAVLENCQVKSVMQTHQRMVTVKLKDGSERRALEPNLDDVISLAVDAKEKCGDDIIIGTE